MLQLPGVGEKTAAKLIAEFGTLEALYGRLDDVTPEKLREKLRDHRDQVFQGQDLSRIVRNLPVSLDLEAARLSDYDRDTVVRLFREYEFRTLIERLPSIGGESAAETAEALKEVVASGTVPAGSAMLLPVQRVWCGHRPVNTADREGVQTGWAT